MADALLAVAFFAVAFFEAAFFGGAFLGLVFCFVFGFAVISFGTTPRANSSHQLQYRSPVHFNSA